MDERTVDTHIDALVDEGVLDYDEASDEVWTTDDFEQNRHVYYDTYLDVDEEEFHRSVADAFDLPSTEAAADRVDRLDVSREEFATYLTLYARLDGYDTGELAEMAGIVVEVGPDSPVPDAVAELDDDSYADFLAEHDRAVVTVWKRGCAPCEGMKSDLDEILAAFPDDAAVGGLDGEQCPDFSRTHEVNAAPAVVFFADGDRLDVVTGRTSPDPLAERVADLYGDD
ncbi:thioredoxin family protein [Halosimplex amylolyticum]|uniref:thioredoxin family protein n=1 Tax=Halosimplex amylolyticum TaxID=3396616 RepID=UPI003F560D08